MPLASARQTSVPTHSREMEAQGKAVAGSALARLMFSEGQPRERRRRRTPSPPGHRGSGEAAGGATVARCLPPWGAGRARDASRSDAGLWRSAPGESPWRAPGGRELLASDGGGGQARRGRRSPSRPLARAARARPAEMPRSSSRSFVPCLAVRLASARPARLVGQGRERRVPRAGLA